MTFSKLHRVIVSGEAEVTLGEIFAGVRSAAHEIFGLSLLTSP